MRADFEPDLLLSAVRTDRFAGMYASDVEPLPIDYFEYWLDREPAASGWCEELRSLAIDK
jgi:hypothetical protein